MKTCDEMVNSLFKRREQYLAQQKIKRRNAVISAALYCCAFAAVVGIGVWIKREWKPITVDPSTPSAGSGSSSADLSNLPIIWANEEKLKEYSWSCIREYVCWNSKNIDKLLSDALEEHKTDDSCLFAVTAYYDPLDYDFVYNGKTLAQYDAEQSAISTEFQSKVFIKRLLEAADSRRIENGDKLSENIYDELVSTIGEEISEYIADGVFLKDKAVQDFAKAEDEFEAAGHSWTLACTAYRVHVYEETLEQLEAQGIKYELSKDDGRFILFVSRENLADLTFDNMSDWRFLHASKKTDLPIIWAEDPKIEGVSASTLDYHVEWNGKDIHKQLSAALVEHENDDNCLFAVRAWRNSLNKQFVYNGKTLAQYESELDAKWNELGTKRYITITKLLSITYSMRIENGDRVSKDTYDKIVSGIGEDISEYIVDGVFLKDKAEQEITKVRDEKEAAEQTFDKACAACQVNMYEKLLEQLDAQGIEYEQSKDPDNLLMFISRDDFANLTFDNMSDWSFYHAYKKTELPIVWYKGIFYTGDIMTVFGNKDINSSLWGFCNEEQNDCLYAIEAQYGFIDKQFVYNGKTWAEYEAEKEAQEKKFYSLSLLLSHGEYLINNKDSYLSTSPEAKKYYDDTIADIGEDIMSEYVVDGVLLKEKAERDCAKAEEDWGTAKQTNDKVRTAYRAYIYEKTAKQLEAQGIKYALSEDSLSLLLFITRDEFANLTLDNMSEWFFEHASKDIYVDDYRSIGGYTADDLPDKE